MTQARNISEKPLLSIIIPCYNVEEYLEKGLSSLCDERFCGKLEVLIINDGSTDTTENIARSFCNTNPRIFRLISKENGGHGSGINTGIREAVGTYFRIIDGDDWVNTNELASLLEKLKDIDTDIVVDEKTDIDMASEQSIRCFLPTTIKIGVEQSFDEICELEHLESFISIHTLSVRTSLLRQFDIHVLEKVFYEDYEYVVKSTCYAKSVTFLKLNVYQYLLGNANQSVAAENFVKRYNQHQKIVCELLKFVRASSFTPEITRYLERKIELLINTHYNILLIFDTDRSLGLKRAKEFKRELKERYPEFAERTEKRYSQAFILHKLGFNKAGLDKLMRRS